MSDSHVIPASVPALGDAPQPRPVPPDAVRVWRGFRLPKGEPRDFQDHLRTIFIPATVQLQRLYGLTAYLPTVLPVTKPAGVPDEIALVFYETQQAYKNAALTVGGRAYALLHQTIFAFPDSQSDFPHLFSGKVLQDTPYYLFTDSVDWQCGWSQVFVGARNASIAEEKFTADMQTFLQHMQENRPVGLDGAIICVSANWVVYWEHWEVEPALGNSLISDFAELSNRVLFQPSVPTPVKSSLKARYAGLDAVDGKSFNTLFPRLRARRK